MLSSRNRSAPVRGTNDLLASDLASIRHVAQRLQRLLDTYGYDSVDVPVLEQTDLYLRKLGSQVAALMFTLTDQQGDRLSLRPEFTGSVIRSYISHETQLPVPVRWQYCGPVFRDQVQSLEQSRQFTQMGAELIGSASPMADAELLTLASKGLREIGFTQSKLVIGNAGLVPNLLRGFQLSERVKMYIAGHVEMLRAGTPGMAKLRQGLEELSAPSTAGAAVSGASLDLLESEEAASLLRRLLQEGTGHSTGRRDPEDILRRFQAKLYGVDDPEHLERALSLVAELAAVCAAPEQALSRGREILERHQLQCGPLEELEAVLALMSALDTTGATFEVDLGLTRPLGYYTGIVFEIYVGQDAAELVGGGGRYDGLVRALGGAQDVPALGFAYTLELLVQAAQAAGIELSSAPQAIVLVVPAEASDFPAAVKYADSLRAQGQPATLEVVERTAEERRLYCEAAGIRRSVVVSSTGVKDIFMTTEAVTYAPASAS